MKKKVLFLIIITLLLLAILCYLIQKQERDPNEALLTQGHFSIIAQQKETHIEYFVKSDPYSIYNYLSGMNLEKAETSVLGKWLYKVILTNTLTPAEEGGYLIPNDASVSVIHVYKNYLEIDGTTYLFPENADILAWFASFYSSNVGDHETFISYE